MISLAFFPLAFCLFVCLLVWLARDGIDFHTKLGKTISQLLCVMLKQERDKHKQRCLKYDCTLTDQK